MAKKSSGKGSVAKEKVEPGQDEAPKAPHQLDPAVLEQIAAIRSRISETFGKVALVMMATPRYRHQQIGDLAQLVLDPLMRDRIAIAQPAKPTLDDGGIVGVAIWASVSEEVDTKIREQIKAGVFPVKLQANDWNSGKINWLLDVIAPSAKAATGVLANFKQVIKDGGDLRIHPLVAKLIEPEALEKMGVSPLSASKAQ